MPVTPLNPPDPTKFTLPYMKPGVMQTGVPNATAAPAPPMTPGVLTAPPTPAPPAPYTTKPATSKDATAVGYDAAKFTVDPNQTVQGQIADIENKDSVLMQQADTRARQKMQNRGLLSSSEAVRAGQAAVIDAALPIAQQDANRYATAHDNTQNAENAARNFGAGATNDASKVNAQLGTNVSLANSEAANKALQDSFNAHANYGLATLDANTKIALANLDVQTKVALTQMENENRQQLQANQDASSMFNQVMTAIANISNNPNLTQEAKDAAISTQLNSLREGLRLQGDVAGLDLGGYFTSGGGPGLSDAVSFSNLPERTDIPNGGHRDQKGNVYDHTGKLMDWRGPAGGDVYMGPTGTIMSDVQAWANANRGGATNPTGNTSAPGTSKPAPVAGGGTAPTGTVTNPAQGTGPRPLTPAEQTNRNVVPWPGARWDNRMGWRQ